MFATDDTVMPGAAASAAGGGPVDLDSLLSAVTTIDCNASDAELIDRIAALERLNPAAAAQARLTATFTASQTTDAAARHHRPDAVARSIAGQIGLARRDSPHTGRRHVGVAAALVGDMPHTLAALACGELSERRARTVVEQLACLTPAGRREADRLLAPDLPGLGDLTAQTRAAAMAYRLDPEAVMAKVRGAVTDRHVSLRPAPDTMSRLSALLPVSLGVAVYAALSKAADTATAAPGGEPRSRGQLMADALVSAVTGHHITGCDAYGAPHYAPAPTPTPTPVPDNAAPSSAAPVSAAPSSAAPSSAAPEARAAEPDHNQAERQTATAEPNPAAPPAVSTPTAPTPAPGVAGRPCPGGCGITINLLMTDRTLLDSDDEPAHLHGYGPVPAALARALVIGSADTTTRTWIRRLYTDPVTGQLADMDSKRRLFPPAAQRFLLARDQTCRTPWCDAPIRQADHIHPHAHGGPTSITNIQGQCQACNLTKEAPRWTSTPHPDGTIHLTVPTGHHYLSRPPTPPRSQPWADISHTEHRFAKLLLWQAG